MLKRSIAISLSFFFLFCFFVDADAIKPRPPLQLALSSVDLSDGKTEITLSARANTHTEGVALIVELPLGLFLIEGETEWEGPLKQGEKISLVVIVQNEETQAYTILARASVRLPDEGRFIQERPLNLNPRKADLPSRRPPIGQKSGGDSILEFRGD